MNTLCTVHLVSFRKGRASYVSCLLVGGLLIALWTHVDSSPPAFERARAALASSYLPAHLSSLADPSGLSADIGVEARDGVGPAAAFGIGLGGRASVSSGPFSHAHYYLTGQFFGEGGRRLPHLVRREPLYVSRQATSQDPTRAPSSWESPRCERHLGLQMLLYATLYGIARSVVRSQMNISYCCLNSPPITSLLI